MGARAATVAATRGRIVAAARALLLEGDFRSVTMDEVARRADVARATVYHHLSSKSGMFEAVLTDREERAGLDELAAVAAEAPVDRLVRDLVRASTRYWATDPELTRTAIALAHLEPALQALLDRHDARRRDLLAVAVDRLGGKPKPALDTLWLTTSFEAYDLLTSGRGLSTPKAAKALTKLTEARLAA
jgi:AcrR family transcriptional regulator